MNDPVPSQGKSEGTRLPELSVTTPKPAEAAICKPSTITEVAPSQMSLHKSSAAPTVRSIPPETQLPIAVPTATGVLSEVLKTTDGATSAPPERHITIAFDGGCLGNPGRGGYGAILVNDRTGSEMIVKGREADTTNNRMELSAAIAGLNALRPGAYVHMLGDSQYVIKGITEWLPGWKAKGWKASGGKPVANMELWRALEMAVERHERVTWEWVRGHNGHELNERVDWIANNATTGP